MWIRQAVYGRTPIRPEGSRPGSETDPVVTVQRPDHVNGGGAVEGSNVLIARQPIFDRRQQVVGYELLSRSSLENAFDGIEPDRASMGVISDSLLVYQLDALTKGMRAYINVTRRLLTQGYLRVLPKQSVVLEVTEDVEPDQETIAACKALKREGYRIALDDFVPRPELEPLIAIADVIKVDFLATDLAQCASVHQRYARNGVSMLAEKVETREAFTAAQDIGYPWKALWQKAAHSAGALVT